MIGRARRAPGPTRRVAAIAAVARVAAVVAIAAVAFTARIALVAALAAGCGEASLERAARPIASASPAPPARDDSARAPSAPAATATRASAAVSPRAEPATGDAAEASAPAAPAAPPARVTIAAVGDVLFGRYADGRYQRVPAVRRPFAAAAPILSRADIAFANLECPIVAEPARVRTRGRLTFRANPGDAALLAGAGLDVISMANNHARDFGLDAAPLGRAHLERAGLAVVGAGAGLAEALRPAVIERGGLRVAFLAWTVWLKGDKRPTPRAAVAYVSNRDLVATVSAQIASVRDSDIADAVVVSLHWGWEPEQAARAQQRTAARALIDAGAHVILGHHPHVVHEVERHRGGVIAYSLGNFLFDNSSLVQRLTLVLEVELVRGADSGAGAVTVGELIVHPMVIDTRTWTPRPLRRREHAGWRRKLQSLAPDARVGAPGGASARRKNK